MVPKKGSSSYLVKVNGQRYHTFSYRRFLTHVRTIKWNKPTLVYLRVGYGDFKDVNGVLQHFYNDGDYMNKKDFDQALNAFLEE